MSDKVFKTEKRIRRHNRIRKIVVGSKVRPRLSVFKSNQHIYCQLIDDQLGLTLAAVSTQNNRERFKDLVKVERTKKVGELIAAAALAKNIKAVVFDRGGFRYHGRIKALAEAARQAGLEF